MFSFENFTHQQKRMIQDVNIQLTLIVQAHLETDLTRTLM
jgi:hypothetical protein